MSDTSSTSNEKIQRQIDELQAQKVKLEKRISDGIRIALQIFSPLAKKHREELAEIETKIKILSRFVNFSDHALQIVISSEEIEQQELQRAQQRVGEIRHNLLSIEILREALR